MGICEAKHRSWERQKELNKMWENKEKEAKTAANFFSKNPTRGKK